MASEDEKTLSPPPLPPGRAPAGPPPPKPPRRTSPELPPPVPQLPTRPPAPSTPAPAAPIPTSRPAFEPRAKEQGSGGRGWIVLILLALAGGVGWWWYQQRQVTPTAVREDTAVGSSASTATAAATQVLIDARPWGRIEQITDTESGTAVALPAASPFTPRWVALPEGAYEIAVTHPHAGSLSCRVDVTDDGRTPTCEVRFFDTDPRTYFKELGW